MTATAEITPEYVENWLSPPQAVKELEAHFGTNSNSYVAKTTLLERLRGRQIRSSAASDTTKPYLIEPFDWKYVDENDLVWRTGDITFHWIAHGSEQRTTRHFCVRFEPAAVRAIIAAVGKQTAVPAQPEAPEPAQKGPPVSDAHLKIWYEAYQKTHQGPLDTLDNAYKSALGMFPGRFASRQRIRDLAGGRKRGRKSENADE